jgi:hypothetical protein
MTFVVATCSLLTGIAAFILLLRLTAASREGRFRLQSAKSRDDFPERVLRLVHVGLDHGLLAGAGSAGLADIEVRARETSDSYRTAADLIAWLAREAHANSYAEVCGLIKGVYQLGATLRNSEEEILYCLEPLVARLNTCSVGGSSITRVECMRQGSLLDTATMAPLNYGARVTQPLGVVVYDSSGRLLGKAKVLCG